MNIPNSPNIAPLINKLRVEYKRNADKDMKFNNIAELYDLEEWNKMLSEDEFYKFLDEKYHSHMTFD